MKSKKFSKKLALSKATIANLGNGEMNGLKGGEPCPTTIDITGNPCFRCITGRFGCISIEICEN
jgi:hypothetical protein